MLKRLCPNGLGFCPNFGRIKFLGVALAPHTPPAAALLHH